MSVFGTSFTFSLVAYGYSTQRLGAEVDFTAAFAARCRELERSSRCDSKIPVAIYYQVGPCPMTSFVDHAGKPRKRGEKDRDQAGLGVGMGRHTALHQSLRNLPQRCLRPMAVLCLAAMACATVGWTGA